MAVFDPTQPFEVFDPTQPTAPRFDPTQPFETATAEASEAPRFDPTQPFETATVPPPEQASEGLLQELGEGVASGAIGIVEGIMGLGALGVDLLADTDHASQITENARFIRQQLGLDPVGIAGKGAEIITQFVAPGLGAASAVSKLSNLGKARLAGKELTKAERFSLSAQQVAAAVGVDFMVANDGMTTIGDFFDGGPTQTDETVGLRGREEAARLLSNRAKLAAEAGLATIAAPVVLGAAGSAAMKTADVVGDVAAPVLSPVARAVKESFPVRKTGEFFTEIERKRVFGEAQNEFLNKVADTVAIFRYRGMLPQEIAAQRSLIAGIGEAEIKKAQTTLSELDLEINRILKGTTDFTRKSLLDKVEAFMTSSGNRNELLEDIPLTIQPSVIKMRDQIDDLSREIIDSDYITRLRQEGVTTTQGTDLADDLIQTIEKNLNSYFRRRYRAKLDPNYKPDAEAVRLARAGFENDKRSTLNELELLIAKGRTPATLGLEQSDEGFRLIGGRVTKDQAEIAAENFLQRHRIEGSARGRQEGRVAVDKLRVGMLEDRGKMPEYQRRLLGEITDTEENFLGTIADLAEFKAVDNYFGRIRQLAENDSGIGRLFIAPGQPLRPGFVVFGQQDSNQLMRSGWGSLEGYAAPERIYKDLTRVIDQDLGTFTTALKTTYAGFLRAKGAVQYGKTVLSPITQIRNVTSAGLFATAQGNVGRGANLWESVRLVIDDIKKLTPEAQLNELMELQQRGVVGTQAELLEIRRLLNEGAATGPQLFSNGVNVGSGFGRMLKESKGGAFLSSVLKKSEDLYQGGDDIWKIYNYKFEQSKLRNAFNSMGPEQSQAYARSRGFDDVEEFIKSEAADIVRNNIPNYNLAPEFIKGLRKLPVGNFIAFPYEIIRTGINTITRGIDELASEAPEIQKIGLRRLTGAATTFAVFPAALTNFAYQVSGVTEEEMKAYQRSIAAPWEKNARLLPTGRDENGLPVYINYSYTNPYDMLERIVNGAVNQYQLNAELGRDPSQGVALAAFEGLSELMSPFLSESIITAKLRDVLPVEQFGRGGQTVTGARVYNPDAPLGDKLARSFAHVMDALVPSVVPVDVRTGEFEPSRFARSFMEATGLNELTGVSPMDRQRRERQIAGEVMRVVTGITENEINPELALLFKGYEFSGSRKNASNLFNTIASRPNIVNSDEILTAYQRANETRFQIYNRFHQVIEDLRTLGMSDREIRKTLKDANVGDVPELMRGRYVPLPVSDDIRDRMRANGTLNLLPRQEIRQIQREQRQREYGRVEEEVGPRPFTPTVPAPAPTTPAPTTPAPTTPAPTTPAPTPTAPAPMAPAPMAPAPALSQPRNQVSPILVPDPATRAAFGIQ
jgi:hypothetical protein